MFFFSSKISYNVASFDLLKSCRLSTLELLDVFTGVFSNIQPDPGVLLHTQGTAPLITCRDE